jgi:hypothetical protein
MPYSYDRRLAKDADPDAFLELNNLSGLKTGKPVTLYHGTTRLFRTFDLGQSRDELVNNYYGKGIFLTPSKRVAAEYANANRNIGFDPSIIDTLKRRNPKAGRFLEILYENGMDGWDVAFKEFGFWTENPEGGQGRVDLPGFEQYVGVKDVNDIQEIADYIIGSASKPLGSGDPVNIFDMSTGLSSYVYDTLDRIGLNSKVYRPKIYTVAVTVSNPLVTRSRAKARKARSAGFDSVVYYGPDLVMGEPEVAVYSPRNVKVRHIEVLD